MDCNSGLRKAFADEVIQSIEALAKKHELGEVIVERKNPLVIAVRGCLRSKDQPSEAIELVAMLSGDLRQAEAGNVLAEGLNVQTPAVQVYRSFDISEVVAKDTAAFGTSPEGEASPCDDGEEDQIK